jgi:hypothetical protein
MTTLIFVAEAARDPKLGYEASFPDFAGLTCQGADLVQLLTSARAAVLSRLQALTDAGESWPTPTPMGEAAPKAGSVAILVDVAVDDTPVRVNISIGERLLAQLDAQAEMRGMTRSGFIAQAVRASLGERAGVQSEFEDMGRRIQDELSSLGKRLNESIGPESTFSRRMVELDDYVFDGVRKAADSVSAAMAKRRSAAPAQTASETPANPGDDHAAV